MVSQIFVAFLQWCVLNDALHHIVDAVYAEPLFFVPNISFGVFDWCFVFPSSKNVESRSTTLSEKELLDYPRRDFVLSTEFLLPRFNVSALAVLGLLPLPCCRRHFTFPSSTNFRLMELSISYCKVLVAMLF